MNNYMRIGRLIAEAMGLISEKRAVHKVGSTRRGQLRGVHGDRVYTQGTAGKPGTGDEGHQASRVTIAQEYDKDYSQAEPIPGAHSTGGSKRGKKKRQQRAEQDEADANNDEFRKGSRMK